MESGSQKVLDAMEKGLRVEEVETARARLGNAGIRACYFLQFGYPGRAWEDIQKTVELVRSTRPDESASRFLSPAQHGILSSGCRNRSAPRRNWSDSDDLCLMFKAAYKDEFYRALRNALHAEVDSWCTCTAKQHTGSHLWREGNCTGTEQLELLRPPASPQIWTTARRDSAGQLQVAASEAVIMADLLLTHGYFLYEDPKELQIMKPYAPLGILYLCSHLRNKGFDVEVFDTTFSSRERLFQHICAAKAFGAGHLCQSDDAQERGRNPQGCARGRMETVVGWP